MRRYEIEADGILVYMTGAQAMTDRVRRMRRNGVEPTVTTIDTKGRRHRLTVDTTHPSMQVRTLRTSKWA